MMTSTAQFMLGVIAIVAVVAAARPRATPWVLIGMGSIILLHGCITIAIIRINDGADPGYPWMNFWLLFATIPVGAISLFIGLITIVIFRCMKRRER